MKITVNGKQREIDREVDLPAVLESFGVDPRLVAVAVNGEVVPRDQYAAVRVREHDTLEIVRMVGGG
jgi:sulfur carrier protein